MSFRFSYDEMLLQQSHICSATDLGELAGRDAKAGK
jgi:hypothetical protein